MVGEDPRFSTANHPVFSMRRNGRSGAQNETITGDDRFSAVETDERFSVGGAPRVDKYGRKVSLQSEVQNNKKKKKIGKQRSGGIDPNLQPQLAVATSRREIEKRVDLLNKLARGETTGNISSDETSSSSGYSEEEDSEDDEAIDSNHNVSHSRGLLDEESVPEGDSYRRVAILNCDWEHMHSKDLLALVSSFCSKGEMVLSVTVYESDYGKHQIELESKHGPGSILRDIEKQLNYSNAGRSQDGRVIHRESIGIVLESDTVAGSTLASDPEILRAYELQKLRYYFAVVECSSISCAETIYSQLDGMEFETSSVALDLRFVPDETTFDGKTVRDGATSIPSNYLSPEFVLKAVQQSSVQCSWDESPAERQVLLKGSSKQGWEDVNEEELEKFLQGSDDDSSDEEHLLKRVKKARKALLGDSSATTACNDDFFGNISESGGKNDDGDLDDGNFFVDDDEEQEEDAEEVTLKDRKEKDGDTPLNKGKRQKKKKPPLDRSERNKFEKALNSRKLQDKRCGQRKEKHIESNGIIVDTEKAQQQQLGQAVDIDNVVNMNSSRSHNDETEEFVDDDALDFDMRALEREDKLKGKKLRGRRKRKEMKREKASGRGFEVDVNDARFSAVLEGTDERFGIDKTAPEFRNTEGMHRILETRLQRHREREQQQQHHS